MMAENEDRFTPLTREVLDAAHREAAIMGHQKIGPEHLLLGILRHQDNFGAMLLHDVTTLSRMRALVLDREQATHGPPEDKKPDPVADLVSMLPTLKKMGSVLLEDVAKRLREL
jgi:ATP-dependent Clp protease ATP-binding subunit ClpA